MSLIATDMQSVQYPRFPQIQLHLHLYLNTFKHFCLVHTIHAAGLEIVLLT